MARLIQVIEVGEHRGDGTSESPHRSVSVYYAVDGTKLWEYDPCAQAPDAEINQQGRCVPTRASGVLMVEVGQA